MNSLMSFGMSVGRLACAGRLAVRSVVKGWSVTGRIVADQAAYAVDGFPAPRERAVQNSPAQRTAGGHTSPFGSTSTVRLTTKAVLDGISGRHRLPAPV